MPIKLRHVSPFIMAGAAAAAIALAAPAGATSNPINCNDKGGATLCQKQGHARIQVDPPTGPPNQVFGFNGIPIWALG